MPGSLSIKNVAGRGRRAVAKARGGHRRSLQSELMHTLEAAAGLRASTDTAETSGAPAGHDVLSIDELARKWFPRGTESSIAYVRQSRDSR
jgi:hypothetical protein